MLSHTADQKSDSRKWRQNIWLLLMMFCNKQEEGERNQIGQTEKKRNRN